MTIVIVSILGLVVATIVVNRVAKKNFCPICLGVMGTWISLLLMRFLGQDVEPAILALLLGASTVGVGYQGAKYLKKESEQLIFKIFSVVTGLVISYGVVYSDWKIIIFGVVAALSGSLYFLKLPAPKAKDVKHVEKIVKQLDNCC